MSSEIEAALAKLREELSHYETWEVPGIDRYEAAIRELERVMKLIKTTDYSGLSCAQMAEDALTQAAAILKGDS